MKKLMKAMAEQAPGHSQAISKVIVSISLMDPPRYQARIKFNDASIAWCVGVDPDPAKALGEAMGKIDGSRSPKSPYYLRKQEANEIREGFLEIYGEDIAHSSVELEPYQGWGVVIRPKPGRERNLSGLAGKVRFEDDPASPVLMPPKSEAAPVPSEKRPAAKSSAGASMTRTEMQRIWEEEYGKQPNSKYKKDELRDIMLEKGLIHEA